MKDNTPDRIKRMHPCFSDRAHATCGRIHLPVAKWCNIRCNYCDIRFDCVNESRPGVTSRLMSPRDALVYLKQNHQAVNRLKVAGIAGPAEPLYNEASFETFFLVEKYYPNLIKCVSTNGLLLRDRARELLRSGVSTVTVTVNTLKPSTAVQIYGYVDAGTLTRLERCEHLLKNQQAGVEKAVEMGLKVKINTVLIPSVNDQELEDIAKFAADTGVSIMNIIPVIPQSRFRKIEPPTSEQLVKKQVSCSRYIPQLSHCARCRADAVGIPAKAVRYD